jgi:uncharacterized protein (TIGR00369 family)
MKNREGFKLLANMENHNCFGCSPVNPSGLQMKFYANQETVNSWLKVPAHFCGYSTLIHGGVISTILDEIMSRTAIYKFKNFIMTKSITVDFIKPLYIEREIRAEGRVLEKLNRTKARIEGFLYNDKDELCAKSTGLFALFTPDVIKKKGLMGGLDAEDFDVLFN